MAGLYIHVPFCKGRCIYCDFYSTTEGVECKSRYVSALLQEIRQRKDELS
ncbi:MAG: coproporphyrinogen III oxidase, partial [Bacteroidaceae bacterium]|nr:coproporphyrinogen III oxidase [Paraprevotella sp.]MDY2716638.1 coproporphyrinogen III oxidase [Bacteroidaceae bacterium]